MNMSVQASCATPGWRSQFGHPTGLMGAAAGLAAMPTGYMLALILIYIINRRSFGWTLQMQIAPGPFMEAFVVAVLAALLAGLYPAWRISRRNTAEAIRFD